MKNTLGFYIFINQGVLYWWKMFLRLCLIPFSFCMSTALQHREASSAQVMELSDKEETCRKEKQYLGGNGEARHSEAVESLEDRDSGFSLTDGYCAQSSHWAQIFLHSAIFILQLCPLCRAGKSKDTHTLKAIRNKPTTRVMYTLTSFSLSFSV